MKDNFLIKIDGENIVEGESEKLSLATLGDFVARNNFFKITYRETEATGFDGEITTLTVNSDKRVTMERTGDISTHLVIERGRRHLNCYDTGYGAVTLGINADEIINNLTPDGGELDFTYSLDVNMSTLSVNRIRITVKARNKDVPTC